MRYLHFWNGEKLRMTQYQLNLLINEGFAEHKAHLRKVMHTGKENLLERMSELNILVILVG